MMRHLRFGKMIFNLLNANAFIKKRLYQGRCLLPVYIADKDDVINSADRTK